MDTLILAAGYGSRLRAVSPVKPLTRVAGVTLLELAIVQAANAGATRAVVVTGHRADAVEASLPEMAHRAGIEVIARRVKDHALPNGHSVIAGAEVIEGDYLLQMADHVFSGSILRRLIAQGSPETSVTLAIDRRTQGEEIDPFDATWVETAGDGRIKAIGKHIKRYNAVDCGAFLATAELAPAIDRAIASGKAGSLSDGMQLLAHERRAATMEINGAWWLDIDDPSDLALANVRAPLHLPEVYGAREEMLGEDA